MLSTRGLGFLPRALSCLLALSLPPSGYRGLSKPLGIMPTRCFIGTRGVNNECRSSIRLKPDRRLSKAHSFNVFSLAVSCCLLACLRGPGATTPQVPSGGSQIGCSSTSLSHSLFFHTAKKGQRPTRPAPECALVSTVSVSLSRTWEGSGPAARRAHTCGFLAGESFPPRFPPAGLGCTCCDVTLACLLARRLGWECKLPSPCAGALRQCSCPVSRRKTSVTPIPGLAVP